MDAEEKLGRHESVAIQSSLHSGSTGRGWYARDPNHKLTCMVSIAKRWHAIVLDMDCSSQTQPRQHDDRQQEYFNEGDYSGIGDQPHDEHDADDQARASSYLDQEQLDLNHDQQQQKSLSKEIQEIDEDFASAKESNQRNFDLQQKAMELRHIEEMKRLDQQNAIQERRFEVESQRHQSMMMMMFAAITGNRAVLAPPVQPAPPNSDAQP